MGFSHQLVEMVKGYFAVTLCNLRVVRIGIGGAMLAA